jgi:hypothetical protein
MNIFKNPAPLYKKPVLSSSSTSSSSRFKKAAPTLQFNQDDFPELLDNTLATHDKEEKTKSLDYKSVSFMNDDDETKEEKKIPGWTYITADKNTGKIQIENYKIAKTPYSNPNPPMIEDATFGNILDDNTPVFSAFEARKGISQLVTSWEIYKQKYIEMYGEDCYRNMYEMPYDDYKFTENDNHVEESSVDEYDSYDEYYDEYDKYM